MRSERQSGGRVVIFGSERVKHKERQSESESEKGRESVSVWGLLVALAACLPFLAAAALLLLAAAPLPPVAVVEWQADLAVFPVACPLLSLAVPAASLLVPAVSAVSVLAHAAVSAALAAGCLCAWHQALAQVQAALLAPVPALSLPH